MGAAIGRRGAAIGRRSAVIGRMGAAIGRRSAAIGRMGAVIEWMNAVIGRMGAVIEWNGSSRGSTHKVRRAPRRNRTFDIYNISFTRYSRGSESCGQFEKRLLGWMAGFEPRTPSRASIKT
jgi:hypothetical protein